MSGNVDSRWPWIISTIFNESLTHSELCDSTQSLSHRSFRTNLLTRFAEISLISSSFNIELAFQQHIFFSVVLEWNCFWLVVIVERRDTCILLLKAFNVRQRSLLHFYFDGERKAHEVKIAWGDKVTREEERREESWVIKELFPLSSEFSPLHQFYH